MDRPHHLIFRLEELFEEAETSSLTRQRRCSRFESGACARVDDAMIAPTTGPSMLWISWLEILELLGAKNGDFMSCRYVVTLVVSFCALGTFPGVRHFSRSEGY